MSGTTWTHSEDEKLKKERNNQKVEKYLNQLKKAAEGTENLMPYVLNCVRSYGTLGEICGLLREIFGEYEEPAIY